MSDGRDDTDLERNKLMPMISVPASCQTNVNQSQSFSIRPKIRLYDVQTGLPVGIYLDNDNTLCLKHVQLIYPHATSVKGFLPDQKEADLFPCENGRIRSPTGIWPEGILEPAIPSQAVPPLSNLLETESRGYAICQLSNPHQPNLSLDAELLVDCGCSIDLILPSREISKLRLRKETGGICARGFNNRITVLPKYNDLKITIDLKNPITNEITTKTAMVSVFERACPDTSDMAIQCERDALSDSVSTSVSRVCTPERRVTHDLAQDNCENVAILKLSPLKYPVKDGDQYGILGYSALKKLNIGIHFGGNYIFGIERRVEHISSLSMSAMIR